MEHTYSGYSSTWVPTLSLVVRYLRNECVISNAEGPRQRAERWERNWAWRVAYELQLNTTQRVKWSFPLGGDKSDPSLGSLINSGSLAIKAGARRAAAQGQKICGRLCVRVPCYSPQLWHRHAYTHTRIDIGVRAQRLSHAAWLAIYLFPRASVSTFCALPMRQVCHLSFRLLSNKSDKRTRLSRKDFWGELTVDVWHPWIFKIFDINDFSYILNGILLKLVFFNVILNATYSISDADAASEPFYLKASSQALTLVISFGAKCTVCAHAWDAVAQICPAALSLNECILLIDVHKLISTSMESQHTVALLECSN